MGAAPYGGVLAIWLIIAAAAHAATSHGTLPQTPPPAQALAPDPPVLMEVTVESPTVFGAPEIARTLRLEAGAPLPAPPEDLARALEQMYAREGYTMARARAAFDEAAGRLTLSVDEGRIDAILFEGVPPEVAERFARDFAVRPGDVFNRREITRALARLLSPTRGAVRPERRRGPAPGTTFTDTRQLARARAEAFSLVDRDGRGVLLIRLRQQTGRVSFTAGTSGRQDWYTPVDGFVPALGIESTIFDHRHFNHTYLSGHVWYRTSGETAGYAAAIHRPLFGGPRLYVGADVHDLTASDDRWRLSGTEQSLAALGVGRSYRDYYRRRGYQLSAAVRLHPSHEVMAAWRDDRHEALANETDWSLFRRDEPFRENLAARSGDLRAIVVGYAWDSRGFEGERVQETWARHLLDTLYGTPGGRLPGARVEWTSELAGDALGGDFDFGRHILNARTYVRLSPAQRLDTRLLLGFSTGSPPPQRQFALGGIGSVRGYDFKEAVGGRMTLLNLEYQVAPHGDRGAGLIGFVDAGRIGRPVAGSHNDWMTGIGLGVRLAGVRVDFGWRLDDIPRSLQVLVRLNPTF